MQLILVVAPPIPIPIFPFGFEFCTPTISADQSRARPGGAIADYNTDYVELVFVM